MQDAITASLLDFMYRIWTLVESFSNIICLKEMRKQYCNHYSCFVTQTGRKDKAFHYLRDYQWHYHRELAIEAGLPMPESHVEYLYKHVQGKRSKYLALYKKGIYSRKNPEEFDIVYEPPEMTGSK